MHKCVRIAIGIAVGLFLLDTGFAEDERDEKPVDWQAARGRAKKLIEVPGRLGEKAKVIGDLGRVNTEDAAKLLVGWSARATKFRAKVLLPEYEELEKKYDRLNSQLLKAYKVRHLPPKKWSTVDHKNAWRQALKKRDIAKGRLEAQVAVQKHIGHAVKRFTDGAAIRWLAVDGLKKLQKLDDVDPVLAGLAHALAASDDEAVWPVVVRLAAPAGKPGVVVAILDWLIAKRPASGFDVVAKALRAKHPTVQRTAVYGMQHYNTPKAVKPLIDALPHADGLIAQEIEDALHWYTGQSFEADANVWKRWWKDAGETWSAQSDATGPDAKRHEKKVTRHKGTGEAATFYGIPTESHRIVFVLDRSGSMKTPAGDDAKAEKEKQKEPRGPVTGGKSGKGTPRRRARRVSWTARSPATRKWKSPRTSSPVRSRVWTRTWSSTSSSTATTCRSGRSRPR